MVRHEISPMSNGRPTGDSKSEISIAGIQASVFRAHCERLFIMSEFVFWAGGTDHISAISSQGGSKDFESKHKCMLQILE
mmetsp:Transcript_12617/g.14320  ORF Transcript_12617/g.14320 Transcript_12617/m.14320 type:complete len:80 (+) Transcript_12617:147-386(+)